MISFLFCLTFTVCLELETQTQVAQPTKAKVKSPFEKSMQKAWLSFRKGKYAKSNELLSRIERETAPAKKARWLRIYELKAQLAANQYADYDQAIDITTKALALARELSNVELEWKALMNLGRFSHRKGRSLLTMQYYRNALKLAERIEKERSILASKIELAKAYSLLGFHEPAHSLVKDIELDPKLWLGTELLLVRVRELVRNEQFDAAIQKLEDAIDEFEANKMRVPYSLSLCVADNYLSNDQSEQASNIYEQLLSDNSIMERMVRSRAQLGMARIDLKNGEFESCFARLDDLLEFETSPMFRRSALAEKIRCAMESGDLALAGQLMKEWRDAGQAVLRERVSDELQFLDQQQVYQKQLRDKRIAAEKLRSDLQVSRANQIFALVFFGTLILSILVAGYALLKQRIAEKDLLYQRTLLEQESRLNDDLKQKINKRVDELKRNQEEQLRLVNRLNVKRRDEALGKLTGGVAHDFNNLITVIQNVNDIMVDQLEDQLSSELQELVTCSMAATRSASEITNRLLVFAKKQDLQPTPIQLSDFFEQYMPLIQQSVGARNRISLVIEDEPWIFTDETQLVSALINLCANSGHALREQEVNPEVRIIVRTVTEDQFKSESSDQFTSFHTLEASSKGGQRVMLSVKDNGCGMSSEDLQRACDPFYSTKSETSGHQFGGTGLGLSVVKGFLEQSQAELDIYSEPGAGTTVRMVFDSHEPSLEPSPFSESSARSALNGVRVLLVDDNEMLLKTLETSLQMAGCVVSAFSSGNLAQVHLKEAAHEFDVMITDVQMPNSIDGITLAKWTEAQIGNLPVILMTGFSDQQISATFPVMYKPFRQEKMVETIQAAMARGGSSETTPHLDSPQQVKP